MQIDPERRRELQNKLYERRMEADRLQREIEQRIEQHEESGKGPSASDFRKVDKLREVREEISTLKKVLEAIFGY